MNELVSTYAFRVFITFMTGSVALAWFVIDGYRLLTTRRTADPTGDKRFGYFMGIGVCGVALLGCLMFWNVL